MPFVAMDVGRPAALPIEKDEILNSPDKANAITFFENTILVPLFLIVLK